MTTLNRGFNYNETTNTYKIDIMVAGCKPADVTIEYNEEYDALIVNADGKKNNTSAVAFRNCYVGVPHNADVSTLKASVIDGILTITMSENKKVVKKFKVE